MACASLISLYDGGGCAALLFSDCLPAAALRAEWGLQEATFGVVPGVTAWRWNPAPAPSRHLEAPLSRLTLMTASQLKQMCQLGDSFLTSCSARSPSSLPLIPPHPPVLSLCIRIFSSLPTGRRTANAGPKTNSAGPARAAAALIASFKLQISQDGADINTCRAGEEDGG